MGRRSAGDVPTFLYAFALDERRVFLQASPHISRRRGFLQAPSPPTPPPPPTPTRRSNRLRPNTHPPRASNVGVCLQAPPRSTKRTGRAARASRVRGGGAGRGTCR